MTPTSLLAYAGETLPLAVWSRRAGLQVDELVRRLDAGWSVADSLGIPAGQIRPTDRLKLLARPCPRLIRHPTGQAAVAWKVKGKRQWVYFGVHGSAAAAARYAEFARSWPTPLLNPPPATRPHAPRLIDVNGKPTRLTTAARNAGLRPGTVRHRVDVLGWPAAKALALPADLTRPRAKRTS